MLTQFQINDNKIQYKGGQLFVTEGNVTKNMGPFKECVIKHAPANIFCNGFIFLKNNSNETKAFVYYDLFQKTEMEKFLKFYYDLKELTEVAS